MDRIDEILDKHMGRSYNELGNFYQRLDFLNKNAIDLINGSMSSKKLSNLL